MPIVILTLVFVDEVLAAVAAGVWGDHVAGVLLAVAAPAAVVVVWWAFASPKARWGGAVVRPLTKVLVFAAASAGLWVAGQRSWAVAMLVFSVVIHALAQLPQVLRVSASTGSPR